MELLISCNPFDDTFCLCSYQCGDRQKHANYSPAETDIYALSQTLKQTSLSLGSSNSQTCENSGGNMCQEEWGVLIGSADDTHCDVLCLKG